MMLRFPVGARRSSFLVLAGVALWTLGSGCEDDVVDSRPAIDQELVPTAPESVLAHLVRSYRAQDIEAYAKLLAPEFRFRFQPVDQNILGSEYWTFEQDSLGTRALFTTTEVSDVRIELIHGPAEPTPEVQHQIDHPGAMRIFVTGTQLEVDEGDSTTWVMKNRQDMYFYRGTVDAGEDTTRWYLFEWRELPLVEAPTLEEHEPVPVGQTSWGRVKARYLD